MEEVPADGINFRDNPYFVWPCLDKFFVVELYRIYPSVTKFKCGDRHFSMSGDWNFEAGKAGDFEIRPSYIGGGGNTGWPRICR